MRNSYGPQNAYSDEQHRKKYRGVGEDFRGAMGRVANALKDDEDHFRRIYDILLDMRFMPAGRVQAAMGAPRAVTPYNCFVSGTIADSYVDGPNSIMEMLKQAAATMRMGGGIGYDFSTLRYKGAPIASLGPGALASGPISFMHVYSAMCMATCSAGFRRGAQMAVLRIDHPDIEEYIRAKQQPGVLEGFNMSIGVTDAFMEAMLAGRSFPLTFEGRTVREVDARALWELVMRSTWDWAEPGVLFIDTMNRLNNLYYCERLAATNPCGEQPLPPYGACLLGSFNLPRYVRPALDGSWWFDYESLRRDVFPVVRAMDNVVDRALYPLPQQEQEAKSKRRMGLGVTGLANAGEAIGHPYGSPGFVEFQARVQGIINEEAYLSSALLAERKGAFPLFDAERYLAGEFVKRLNERTRWAIYKYGIRNSHLTSIAPTGTISLCADNVSSGLEPVFDYAIDRKVIDEAGTVEVHLEDYGVKFFGVRGKRARDVTAEEHVRVLATAQRYVDSAVSKTCNVNGRMPWEDFKGLYQMAWEMGCKGCTTFNEDGKRMGILTGASTPAPSRDPDAGSPDQLQLPIGTEEVGLTCEFDPATGRRSCE